MLRAAMALLCVCALSLIGQPTQATATAQPPSTSCSSTQECDDGCCPTHDPNVDCWADGHWHYNHCKSACTVE